MAALRDAGGERDGRHPAVIRKMVDALQDGVALADAHGSIALANTRLEEMFGYQHGELAGRPVEYADPRRPARGAPKPAGQLRLPASGAADGRPGPTGRDAPGRDQFPGEISLSPVATAAGQFALTVIRDVTEARRVEDLAGSSAPR